MSNVQNPTYFLAPNWNFPPGGRIAIGKANHGKEAQGTTFCDWNHTYLQLSVEGWEGITDRRTVAPDSKGDVRDMAVDKYLKEVQGMCAEAWEAFWQGP